MIEKAFDVAFIADLALREKQIQQEYRPIIAVHKWFARRPGTLFRGLLLAEFSGKPLREAYYQSNRLPGIRVADPFMGGGTPLLEANRLGCDVVGLDVNPMAYWIVRQEMEHLDLDEYALAAERLRQQLEQSVGEFYRTRCVVCGSQEAHVKYFLWVKTIRCRTCHNEIDLFPGYLLAADVRHPKNVFVCPACGQLSESTDRKRPGLCHHCGATLLLDGPASRSRCLCRYCRRVNEFPDSRSGPPRHRLFALEYYCARCKGEQAGRFFKSPDTQDLQRVAQSEQRWADTRAEYAPDDEIPSGDETNRLHRWGYSHYRQMFSARQLLGLELSAALVARTADRRIRHALATNLSDLLRYQNMLCRYDTKALKSLDIFSVHGFPVGLIQCESNLLGITSPGTNVCVGSGGWANIVEKYRKAKAYCDSPFEVRHDAGRKVIVPIPGEWIGERRQEGRAGGAARKVDLHCHDAASWPWPTSSLDAVFTDPPYFGNVQYAELMDFCYVWLRRLVGNEVEAFANPSTRHPKELTVNEDMGRGMEHFAEGMSRVFQRVASALKPGAALVFTYHHNNLAAYVPLAVSILDAGMTCSASFPCPAEMSASIHIKGTESSIVDTVFVCRSTGRVPRGWIVDSKGGLAELVKADSARLQAGRVKPTPGDLRCITFGHLVRLAVWNLRVGWDKDADLAQRLSVVSSWLDSFGTWNDVELLLAGVTDPFRVLPLFAVRDGTAAYGVENDGIPF